MTTEVLRQRAEIEESIRGKTVCDQLRLTAEQFPDCPALSQAFAEPASDGGGTLPGGQTLTWAQALSQVRIPSARQIPSIRSALLIMLTLVTCPHTP